MQKPYAVYKRTVGIGTERVVDSIQADSERDAVVRHLDNPILRCNGAIGFMDTFFTAYSEDNTEGVYYFAGEVK